MHNWIDYLINEEAKEVLSTENGFIAFKVIGNEMLVTDFYVDKNKRNQGAALVLGEAMELKARELKCSFLSCNVYINKKNANMFARKVDLFSRFGFLPVKASNDAVTMFKDLTGE